MTDFHFQRTVKAVRRTHECEQCGTLIQVGEPAEYGSGKYDGYLYSIYTHVECQAAAVAYADMNGLYGEDWPWFQHNDRDPSDDQWLLEEHPVVAGRLGIEATTDQTVKEEA